MQTVISNNKYTYKLIDYVKIWVTDCTDITRILANELIEYKGNYSRNTGEILSYPLTGRWNVWEFEIKSATWLQITGSLHKFWNKGTNGNDFYLIDLLTSITDLCNILQINPHNMSLHNLEFGVNIRPDQNASVILQNVICYKNRESIRGITEDKFFIEFAMGEYYLKLYDKGKQARKVWGIDIGNVLRVEVKAMNSGYFADAGVKTLADLLNSDNLQVLGKKINKVFRDVVFDDYTITPDAMTVHDQKNYLLLRNPREWTNHRGCKDSTIAAREKRFRAIVGKYGSLNLHNTLSSMIADKWNELLTATPDTLQRIEDYLQHCKLCGNSYLIYTPKTYKVTPERSCISCGRDISDQHAKSKFCSAKFVGEQQAHKCRNDNSNPRNTYNRQLTKISSKGQMLFDITPYLKKVS